MNYVQLPDLVNNQPYLKGEERLQIDMLIDYLLNFVYVPILMTNDFRNPQPLTIING